MTQLTLLVVIPNADIGEDIENPSSSIKDSYRSGKHSKIESDEEYKFSQDQQGYEEPHLEEEVEEQFSSSNDYTISTTNKSRKRYKTSLRQQQSGTSTELRKRSYEFSDHWEDDDEFYSSISIQPQKKMTRRQRKKLRSERYAARYGQEQIDIKQWTKPEKKKKKHILTSEQQARKQELEERRKRKAIKANEELMQRTVEKILNECDNKKKRMTVFEKRVKKNDELRKKKVSLFVSLWSGFELWLLFFIFWSHFPLF